jgi:hypothetical protein
MIKLDLLDALSDKELDEIEAYSQALKKRRDEERKAKALNEAGVILAAAGISLRDLNVKTKKQKKTACGTKSQKNGYCWIKSRRNSPVDYQWDAASRSTHFTTSSAVLKLWPSESEIVISNESSS